MEMAQISEKFKNNPKTTLILGGDFNAGGIKSITSIPGISDHNIVLADCKLKPSIITKPQRKIYQWSKADWRSLREQTVVFAEDVLASATTRSVNENYIKFRTYLEEVMENKIPSKLSSKLPWFNKLTES